MTNLMNGVLRLWQEKLLLRPNSLGKQPFLVSNKEAYKEGPVCLYVSIYVCQSFLIF